MPFRVIKGTFHAVGYQPDGDSLRFHAANSALWLRLDGRTTRLNSRHHAQLRFEAIDALELHYNGTRQPSDLARAARDNLLRLASITNVGFREDGLTVAAAEDGVPGYVISRETERNGRPVAFVFAGTTDLEDGQEIFLEPAHLADSLNVQQLAQGMAYPTYYKGLFSDLREALTRVVETARSANLGLWPQDRTNRGLAVASRQDLEADGVILPKLFRRLVDFLATGQPISAFRQYLEDRNEEIFILGEQHFTHFDTVVEVQNGVVRLTRPPEQLVFTP